MVTDSSPPITSRVFFQHACRLPNTFQGQLSRWFRITNHLLSKVTNYRKSLIPGSLWYFKPRLLLFQLYMAAVWGKASTVPAYTNKTCKGIVFGEESWLSFSPSNTVRVDFVGDLSPDAERDLLTLQWLNKRTRRRRHRLSERADTAED